jgi:hypothetical protein
MSASVAGSIRNHPAGQGQNVDLAVWIQMGDSLMQQPSVSIDEHTAWPGWGPRMRATAIHLALSVIVASLAALLVFVVWYPYPYREISGGRDLFLLVVVVDVVLGPLLTLTVFNLAKPRSELRRDLAVVALLQVAGLAYGLWTVNLARPVHLVFEIDRFRAVHRVEIPSELESRAPPGVQIASWKGPSLLAVRPFASGAEETEMTLAALQGLHLSARPDLWQAYEAARPRVLAASRPLADLRQRFPARAAEIDAEVRRTGRDAARIAYLPLISRTPEGWTVLVDGATAELLGFLPIDSF